MIEGFVPIRPMSVNTAWQGRRFSTPEKKAYEQAVLLSLQAPKTAINTGDIELELVFYLVHPRRSDLDNFVKISQDILQKRGYFRNDNQIVSLIARKEQSDKEGWKFTIANCE